MTHLQLWVIVQGLNKIVEELVQEVSDCLTEEGRSLEFEPGNRVRQGGDQDEPGGLGDRLEAVPEGHLSRCLTQNGPLETVLIVGNSLPAFGNV